MTEAAIQVTEAAIHDWLTRQCELIRGVDRGVVLLASAEPSLAARWPAQLVEVEDLSALAGAALTEREARTLCRPPTATTPLGFCLVAVPFSVASLSGVVAVEVEGAKETEIGPVVDLLRLGTRWLELLVREPSAAQGGSLGFEVASLALEQPCLRSTAMTVTTELAARLRCERVSVGLLHGHAMRVHAVSHTARFDARASEQRRVQAAMEEAGDQDAVIAYPPVGGSVHIAREHERLGEHTGGAALTVPLVSEGSIMGALTFERLDTPFDDDAHAACRDAAGMLGPILALRRSAEKGPLGRIRESLGKRFGGRGGSGIHRARLVAALVVVAGLVLVFAEGEYRVTADAKIEGSIQRAIVAGTDGYIAEAVARAGDVLKQGQPLGRLDDRDLVLERRKWTGRRDQLRKEYRDALAALDRAEVNIVSARIAQAEAQLDLIAGNLSRTRMVAPFDGVVVRGDLSQSLGSPVSKGDVLFEMAPIEGYRVILGIDERDVSHVRAGSRGRLVLLATPGERLPITVERVTPVAVAKDGRNLFRVEARLDEPKATLRPGLEGVAKLDVDRRRLSWIWTHEMVDWITIWAWSWWP